VVDADVLESNVARMAAFARQHGLALRPHAKTHKSPLVGRLQLAVGAVGLTVATVSEAEVFADGGAEDLFVAFPLWVDSAKGARLRDLAARVRLTIGVDSVEAVQALSAELPGVAVLVEVDCGHHRSGIDPEAAGAVGRAARDAGLDVLGAFTFPGHSYAPGAGSAVAREESDALRAAAASLSTQGIEPSVLSGGSTPSVANIDDDVATEVRPGVYVFGDAQQWELGSCFPEDIALTCAATVVSHAGRRVVLDAGSKVLGADRATYSTGFGRLLDHPDARIVLLSEHHAVLTWPDAPFPPLGSRLRVVPNHVCSAVNLADQLVIVRAGAGEETWPVAARGANT